jgi:hypothetical protein
MKKPQKLIRVKIVSSRSHDEFDVISHEIVGFPAGTYHKLVFPGKRTLFLNDFGVVSVGLTMPGDDNEEEEEENE